MFAISVFFLLQRFVRLAHVLDDPEIDPAGFGLRACHRVREQVCTLPLLVR